MSFTSCVGTVLCAKAGSSRGDLCYRAMDLELNEVDDDGGSDTAVNEVFVGGLPPNASDEEVKEAFAEMGQVLSVRLNRRKKTGECKGFGFIRYADAEAAERAIAEITQARNRLGNTSASKASRTATRDTRSGALPFFTIFQVAFFAGVWQKCGRVYFPR